MKTRLVPCLLFLLFVSACGPNLNDPYEPIVSGVKGQALIGPMCPVLQTDIPCPDQPHPTTLVILTLDGREVTRFQTNAEGEFAVNLPPGDYILHPENANVLPFAADIPFTVIENQFTNIIITFDSGIR
ncbi:MAG: hypothetical protein HFACDABA_02884 [Anaerolineales bacterium]|nr:hypothetical protein [Anaerolineales bacterium]